MRVVFMQSVFYSSVFALILLFPAFVKAEDVDNDGIEDLIDECIEETVDTVDARGCSITQLDRTQFIKTSLVSATNATQSLHYFDDAHLHWGEAQQYERHPSFDVVVDNVTGLWWEDTDSVILRNLSFADAQDYCNNLTLGGIDTWRLPKDKELHGLIDYSQSDIMIPPAFIHRVAASSDKRFFSGDVRRLDTSGGRSYVVDVVNFSNGTVDGRQNTAHRSPRAVRCVSGDPKYGSIEYAAGAYFDYASNLEWSRVIPFNNENRMYWNDAIKSCEALEYKGHDDWRLPNIKELLRIIRHNSTSGADFDNRYRWELWSSTVHDGNVLYAGWDNYKNYYVNRIVPGTSDDNPSGAQYYARCVRDNAPPTIELNAPESIFVNQTLLVDASEAMSQTGRPIAYSWRIANSQISTDPVLEINTLAVGNHTVELFLFSDTQSSGIYNDYSFNIEVLESASNVPPVAEPLRVKVRANATASGQATATDAENASLTFSILDQPSQGSVSMQGDGQFSYYRQGASLAAPVEFTFRAFDGQHYSEPAVVTIEPYKFVAPTAVAGGDRSVIQNISFSLDASQSSDNFGIETYEWYRDGVLISNDITLTQQLSTSGSYEYRLRVIDAGGLTDDDTFIVHVGPIFPAVISAVEGEEISIVLLGDNPSDSIFEQYRWRLNGEIAFGTAQLLVRLTAGVHTVELEVEDFYGNIGNAAVQITVEEATNNQAPIANAGEDIFTFPGQTVYLNGGLSSDDIGITEYEWRTNDGFLLGTSVYENYFATTNINSVNTISLSVSDFHGLTDSDTVNVYSGPILPQTITRPLDGQLALSSEGDSASGHYDIYEWRVDGVLVSSEAMLNTTLSAFAREVSLTIFNSNRTLSATATATITTPDSTLVCSPQLFEFDEFYVDTFPEDDIPYYTTDLESVEAIKALFNYARMQDTTIDRMLKMPDQSTWDTWSSSQQALYLINSEREARGLRPFSGVSHKVTDIADAFAKHLVTHNVLTHHRVTDGASPSQRLDADQYILDHRDAHILNENAFAWSSAERSKFELERSAIPLAVYGFIYHDKYPYNGARSWGHRMSILQAGLDNNSGLKRDEGIIGVGLHSGYSYDPADPSTTSDGVAVVINLIDPSSSWENLYQETVDTSQAHGCFSSTVSFNDPDSFSEIEYLQLNADKTQILVGDTLHISVTGFYSDGREEDLSHSVVLDTHSNQIIDATGNTVHGIANGQATIFAELNGVRSNGINIDVGNEISQRNATTVFGQTYRDAIAINATKEFDERLLNVVTGHVYDVSGEPLANANVAIAGRPEYGTVQTDDSGRYVMAAHAGPITVSVSKPNYIESHRSLITAGNQWNVVESITLLKFSDKKTTIDFTDSSTQVHVSEMVSDERGSRAATLVFNNVTGATITDPIGNQRQVTELLVSATEFSTPQSMPASLPEESAFTYCAEFAAVGVNADESIEFDNDVVMYVDNFLGFDVGEVVPVGYYDRAGGEWVASENGVVVRLLDVDNDSFIDGVDYNDDGIADDLDGDGNSADEVAGIESYPVGQTYWRASTRHFTPFDLNWSANTDGRNPRDIEFSGDEADLEDDECSVVSSYIKPKSLEFHEDIAVLGTDLTLHYSSRRAEGFHHLVEVRVSDTDVPSDAVSLIARLEVAGHRFEQSFMPLPNQIAKFEWDGFDIDGVRLEGAVKAKISVGYQYDGEYYRFASAVEQPLNQLGSAWAQMGTISTGIPSAELITRWSTATTDLFNAPKSDIGNGWSLSNHHQLTPKDQVLRGDGTSEYAPTSSKILKTGINTSVVDGDDGFYQQKGLPHTFEVTTAGEVVDKVTGLTWTHYSAIPPQVETKHAALDYCATYSNENTQPGDWRLPTEKEKAYGVEKSGANLGLIQYQINAADLWTEYSIDQGRAKPVLCVRGPRLDDVTQSGLERDATKQIVIDNQLQIAWQDTGENDSVKMNWREAINYCETLEHAGISEWRLPNINELIYALPNTTFVYQTQLDETLTQWTPSSPYRQPYWASTPNAGNIESQAWAIESVGYTWPEHSQEEEFYNVRCVADYNKGRKSPYVFDASGRHVQTIDPITGTVQLSFGYNESNQLISVVDNLGNEVELQRDSYGAVERIVSPDGYETALTVDGENNLTEVLYPNGGSYRFSYIDELLTWQSDPNGNEFNRVYDSSGRIQSVFDPEGGSWEYFKSGNGVSQSYGFLTAEGTVHESTITKDIEGRTVKTTTFSDGSTLIRTYADDIDIFEYDSGLIEETRKSFDIEKQRYVTDEVRITQPGGFEHITLLSKSTNPLTQNDELAIAINGKTYVVTQDLANSTYTYTSPMGRKVTSTYDPNTQLVTQTQIGDEYPIEYEYDDKGRLLSISQNERRVDYSYDNVTGLLTNVTNQLNEQMDYGHDEMGQVISQLNQLGDTTYIDHDLYGNPTGITPPGKPQHSFTYDGNNLAKDFTSPDVDHWALPTATVLADGNRRVGKIIRADGDEVQFFYRRKNSGRATNLPISPVRDTSQLESVLLPDGSEYSFEYNANHHIKNATSPDNQRLVFAYKGDLPTKITWEGETVGKFNAAYYSDFSLKRTCVNGTRCATIKYDDDGLPKQIGATRLLYTNDLSGHLRQIKVNKLRENITFNRYGDIKSRKVKLGKTEYFSTLNYFDALGRLESVDHKTQSFGTDTSTYSYDGIGRLLSATKYGSTTDYTYDANGNRLSRTSGSEFEIGTYDNQDRLLTYGDCVYTHNIHGERTSATCGDEKTTYKYDVMGNLRDVKFLTLDDTLLQEITYGVDAFDRRIARYVDGVKTAGYLYQDQLSPVAELDANNNLVSRFVYGTRSNVPDYMIKDGKNYRFITDFRGSPLLLIETKTGDIAQELRYDEFGRVIYDSNPGFQPFGFGGGLYDADTGFVRFGARDYDAFTGRWTAKDPLGFGAGDTNLYVFAFNDPINLIDENGLLSNSAQTIINGGAGFLSGLTFGLSDYAIEHVGLGEYVDKCSGAYNVGEFASNFTSAPHLAKGLVLYASKAVTKGAKNATEPNRIYSARELIRRAENPRVNNTPNPNHNFPESFNTEIFKGNKTVVSDNYHLYTKPGALNGRSGVFEIGVRPSVSGRTEVITHRFFRPDKK